MDNTIVVNVEIIADATKLDRVIVISGTPDGQIFDIVADGLDLATCSLKK